MDRNKNKSILAVLFGVLAFVVGSVGLLYFVGHKIATQTRLDGQFLLAQIDNGIKERYRILTHLNSLKFDKCDDSTLLAMRQMLFDAKYVIDIGFFKDDRLVCTTGAGVLAEPIDDKQPDYITANEAVRVRYEPELYLLLFTKRPMEVLIVRQGDYNLILQAEKFDSQIVISPYWQAFYKNSGQFQHLAGETTLYNKIKHDQYLTYETEIVCSQQQSHYCIALYLPWHIVIANNRLLFFICFVLICLASISIALLVDYQVKLRRTTIDRVRRGLAKDAFYWAYQPIINLRTGKIIGCEVLARFEDSYGVLSPLQFIPVLRQADLTWQFTEKMIATVLTELAAVAQLPKDFKVSLNIFPCDVERGNVVSLTQIPQLINSRFMISLEITEDEYLDTTIAHGHFKTLAAAGFHLSLDDFGTGYSNLKNLHHLNFQQLKIDRTFVQDITTEGLKASMIPNIMALVHKFGYTCVAEGIETAEQEAILKTAGVHFGQGWKYGRPMAIAEFKKYLVNTLK